MPNEARIRIALATGELEIEGSDEFIARYEASVRSMLERLEKQTVSMPAPDEGSKLSKDVLPGVPQGQKPEFGELLHSLPTGAAGTDQILLAGYYAGQGTSDNTFSTNDANKLLIEQGIKLSNPSQSLKNNLTAKRVFKVGSRYRVSKIGEQHVQSFTGS
jgi:hypothetical protein